MAEPHQYRTTGHIADLVYIEPEAEPRTLKNNAAAALNEELVIDQIPLSSGLQGIMTVPVASGTINFDVLVSFAGDRYALAQSFTFNSATQTSLLFKVTAPFTKAKIVFKTAVASGVFLDLLIVRSPIQ